MSVNRRTGTAVFWAICTIVAVTLYAAWAHQFVQLAGHSLQQWIDGVTTGYTVAYAPMRGW